MRIPVIFILLSDAVLVKGHAWIPVRIVFGVADSWEIRRQGGRKAIPGERGDRGDREFPGLLGQLTPLAHGEKVDGKAIAGLQRQVLSQPIAHHDLARRKGGVDDRGSHGIRSDPISVVDGVDQVGEGTLRPGEGGEDLLRQSRGEKDSAGLQLRLSVSRDEAELGVRQRRGIEDRTFRWGRLGRGEHGIGLTRLLQGLLEIC